MKGRPEKLPTEIEKNYILRSMGSIVYSLLFGTLSFTLFYFGFKIWAALPALLFFVYTIGIIREYKYHKQLVKWLDENPDARLFIYSSKKKYIKLIEEEILPALKGKAFLIKNDNAIITGDLTRAIYLELHSIMKIKDLPLVITFQGNKFTKTSFNQQFEQVQKQETDKSELLVCLLETIKPYQNPSG